MDLDSLICRNIQHFISARQLLQLSRLMVPLGVMGSNNCVIGITVKLYACKWRTKLGRKINPAGPPKIMSAMDGLPTVPENALLDS